MKDGMEMRDGSTYANNDAWSYNHGKPLHFPAPLSNAALLLIIHH